MSEKPITQRIKDRLAAYTAMLRDIDNQLERLDRMEMTMASPPGPDLTGMPRGSGTPSDRTGMMVERKMELEEQIDRLKAEEKQERNAIEGLILQLSDPDERAVIRLRYFDRADWESTCGVLFGDRRDYVDRVDAYQNRTYKIHGRALLNLAAVLDELEPLPAQQAQDQRARADRRHDAGAARHHGRQAPHPQAGAGSERSASLPLNSSTSDRAAARRRSSTSSTS